jgi:hypothetical protein
MRWLINLALSLNLAFLLVITIVSSVLNYFFNPIELLVTTLDTLEKISKLICIFLPLALARTQTYNTLVRPILFIQRLITLRNLMILERACRNLPPKLNTPMPLDTPSIWKCREPELHISKILTALLDYKHSIKSSVEIQSDWLHEFLSINDDQDYPSLTKVYSELGKKLQVEGIPS